MSSFAERVAALSPEHRVLLELQLKQKKLELLSGLEIPQRTNSKNLPLSSSQERSWLLHQLEPNRPIYNESILFRLKGKLNCDFIQKAILEIIKRHETLRTSVQLIDGQPIQVIATTPVFHLPFVDLQQVIASEQEAEVQILVTKTSSLSFEMTEAPLLRGMLIQLKPEEHVMLLTAHHLISDGWSWQVFFRELSELYSAFYADREPQLEPLSIQYADFSLWQRKRLENPELSQQLSYWKQQLADTPSLLELPTDFPRPAVQTFQGARRSLSLPHTLAIQLQQLSQDHQVTLFAVLLSAFQVLLYRYSGNLDIAVGTPVANRLHRQIEPLIGCFINSLVVRSDLSNNPLFIDFATQVHQLAQQAQANQEFPFEQLVQELKLERSLSHTPLFQVLFILQARILESLSLPDISIEPMLVDSGIAKVDLSLYIDNRPEEFVAIIEYTTDLFKAETIDRMLNHWQTLLNGIVANPNCALLDLPLLTDAEQKQIQAWNQTQSDYPKDRCIHEWFELQVQQTPDGIAIVFGDEKLTYQQLNDRANQLANYLQNSGVTTETLVAICVERSIEMIVGLLGILKAGGAYVPLDPAYPPERLSIILEDTQAPVLLTQQSLLPSLPENQAQIICLDRDWQKITHLETTHLETTHLETIQSGVASSIASVTSQNLAYVIYTSGSTGIPKGVAIEHRSTGALIHWAQQTFSYQELSGVLASTSICFDLSVFEIFVPLTVGGTVFLVDNILQLPQLFHDNKLTLINTVPSAIAELLRVNGIPQSVQTVNIAGEPLPKKLVENLYKLGTVQRVYNLYGPSEDTTYSTGALIPKDDRQSPSIGRPILNTQTHILDQSLQPVPIGVTGELYISGSGLAREYLHRPELTTERFIHFHNSRFYKTGDLARYRSDGNIEYLGRIDHQVKLRGFRIELGEIETVLSQHPQVERAVVLARQINPNDKSLNDKSFDKSLVAYVVSSSSVEELRSFLQQKLPAYMVPSIFVTLKTLPLTPNGKIDRQALPMPEPLMTSEVAYVKPQTDLEQKIVEIWRDVLQLSKEAKVGIEDNFFHLGGHSLLLARVQTQLNQQLGYDLPLVALFQYPTIRSLAQYLNQDQPQPVAAQQGHDRAALRASRRTLRQHQNTHHT